jgi:RNA polymerase sigma-70 factor (ECF subfamily)
VRTLLASHEAEDVTQEAFLNALNGLSRYDLTQAPFRVWLFVIMKNTAIKHAHKLRRTVPVEPWKAEEYQDRPISSDMDLVAWLSDRALAARYQLLPEPQRQVLALRYVFDLSHTQIAAVIDRRADDVRMLHSRAVRRLRSTVST